MQQRAWRLRAAANTVRAKAGPSVGVRTACRRHACARLRRKSTKPARPANASYSNVGRGYCVCKGEPRTMKTDNPVSQPPVAEHDPRDDGCLCQRCGTRYKVDLNLSDELWQRIHGAYNLLCGMCITR